MKKFKGLKYEIKGEIFDDELYEQSQEFMLPADVDLFKPIKIILRNVNEDSLITLEIPRIVEER